MSRICAPSGPKIYRTAERSRDCAAASNAAPASDGDANVFGTVLSAEGAAFSAEGLTAVLHEVSTINSTNVRSLQFENKCDIDSFHVAF